MFVKSVEIVKKEFSDIKIFIDPLEVDEIDYHDNISFKVYSKEYKELFNGGFYFVNVKNVLILRADRMLKNIILNL